VRRVIHEIRNHLAVAIANVEAFRDGVLEPSPKRLSAVLQALGEVDVLLRELSPGQAASPVAAFATERRSIDVCDVITNEVLAFEAAAAERGIEFRVQQCATHDPACLNFAGDPVRIAEIVNNLVSNAIRYTPGGGRIDIDCRRSGDALMLTVNDGGPGVSRADAGRIFESGFRGAAAAHTEGSGLGLSLVKRFVEEHGGTIEVGDADGGGARFTVRLPGTPRDVQPHRHDDGTISLL
jgi:two-component system sensor histidine kinase BaeS